MKPYIDKFCGWYAPIRSMLHMYFDPIVMLAIRLYIANLYFLAAWTKLAFVRRGETETLYSLFGYYHLNFLPVELLAWLWMLAELLFAAMLVAGFMTRFAALGVALLALIVYTADANPPSHYLLLFLLDAVLVARGAGLVSVDAWLWRKYVIAHDPPAHPEKFQ